MIEHLKSKLTSPAMLTNVVALAVALYQFYIAPIPAVNPLQFGVAVSLINLGLHAKPAPAPPAKVQ